MALPLADRRDLRQIDWILIVAVLGLVTIGLLLVYSATAIPGSQHEGFAWRQLTWFGIGIVCAYAVAAIHYRNYDTLAWVGYAISLILLVAVFFVGVEVYGAKRWLRFAGFQFQPSELAKLSTIFVLARHLDQKRLDLSRAKNWIAPFFIVLIPMVLVMKEPDLATSLSFFVFAVAMMFWAGMPLGTLLLALSPVMSVGLFFLTKSEWPFALLFLGLLGWTRPRAPVLVVLLLVNLAVGIALPHLWDGLKPYQRDRIETFLNPGQDPTGSGYQVIQSRIAIGSGGPTGRGFTVATTVFFLRVPNESIDLAHIAMMTSPSTTCPFSSTKMRRSASPSSAIPICAPRLTTSPRT